MTNHKKATSVINTGNAFEQKARLAKALTLFAHLPSGFLGASAANRKACATLLRSWDNADVGDFRWNGGG